MSSEILVKEVLKNAEKELAENLIFEPRLSAEALVSFGLNLSKEELFSQLRQPVSSSQLKKVKKLVERRKKHEPVSQIIGRVNFCGLGILVNKNVLTPRQETELLIEEATRIISDLDNGKKSLDILDLGTGSGAIACVLAKKSQEIKTRVKVFASDISVKSLKVAKKNAKNNSLNHLIIFKRGDLFRPWKGQKFDLIVANLPYIPTVDRKKIDQDVLSFEPQEALFSGEDGLDLYRIFFKELPNYLHKKGQVVIEIGDGQGSKIKSIVLENMPSCQCVIKKDLAKIDRIAIISSS